MCNCPVAVFLARSKNNLKSETKTNKWESDGDKGHSRTHTVPLINRIKKSFINCRIVKGHLKRVAHSLFGVAIRAAYTSLSLTTHTGTHIHAHSHIHKGLRAYTHTGRHTNTHTNAHISNQVDSVRIWPVGLFFFYPFVRSLLPLIYYKQDVVHETKLAVSYFTVTFLFLYLRLSNPHIRLHHMSSAQSYIIHGTTWAATDLQIIFFKSSIAGTDRRSAAVNGHHPSKLTTL